MLERVCLFAPKSINHYHFLSLIYFTSYGLTSRWLLYASILVLVASRPFSGPKMMIRLIGDKLATIEDARRVCLSAICNDEAARKNNNVKLKRAG